jgi:hypothetical protein
MLPVNRCSTGCCLVWIRSFGERCQDPNAERQLPSTLSTTAHVDPARATFVAENLCWTLPFARLQFVHGLRGS